MRSGANVCSSDGRPIGIWNPLRVSRWRSPLSGKSTVRQTAPNPAAWTRCNRSTVSSRSVNTYSCHHFGAPEAAATSSRSSNAVLETTMTVPARAAARAVASSPSGCACFWYAHGATSTGNAISVPGTDVDGSTGHAPVSIRGRITQSSNARRFSARVHSSPAPPA